MLIGVGIALCSAVATHRSWAGKPWRGWEGVFSGVRLMTSLIDLEPAACGEKQFGTCDLGDVRWTQRLVRYAQQMADKRDASKLRQRYSHCDTGAGCDCHQWRQNRIQACWTREFGTSLRFQPAGWNCVSRFRDLKSRKRQWKRSERSRPRPRRYGLRLFERQLAR